MTIKTITYDTETHKLVPLEPTLPIIACGVDHLLPSRRNCTTNYAAQLYRAMLKAASEYEGLPPSTLTEWLKTQPQTVGNVEQNDD